MIDRNFFMCWVGGNIPEYALRSFAAFRDVNPSFNCEFIHFSFDDFAGWDRKLENYKVRGVRDFKWCISEDSPRHRVEMCNMVKYYLVQTHGGIYADCDLFPIRPFDEQLVSITHPFKISKTRPPSTNVTDDIFFMGCPVGMDMQTETKLLPPVKMYDFSDKRYIALRDKFFSTGLQYGEAFNDPSICYVDHYDSNTYGRNKNGDSR